MTEPMISLWTDLWAISTSIDALLCHVLGFLVVAAMFSAKVDFRFTEDSIMAGVVSTGKNLQGSEVRINIAIVSGWAWFRNVIQLVDSICNNCVNSVMLNEMVTREASDRPPSTRLRRGQGIRGK